MHTSHCYSFLNFLNYEMFYLSLYYVTLEKKGVYCFDKFCWSAILSICPILILVNNLKMHWAMTLLN